MALVLWRIVKEKHASNAFDGAGAKRYGGRWNPHGLAAVYLGGSLSLAALETFVHLTAEDARLRFVAIRVSAPDNIAVEALDVKILPGNWRGEPPPAASQTVGGEWLRAGRTALLRVPSVIVPHEANYLLNPLHPDARRLVLAMPQEFGFDQRMWK